MQRGIAAYRAHPYRRDLPDPPVLWSEGGTRLLDFAPGGRAPGILCVPSLVNRAYILDLSARRSLMRFLAERGFRPLLVDWGEPDAAHGSVSGLIAGRLSRALGAAVSALGGPVGLLGYCMGGTMAAALAALRPGDVRALAVLAAPWDFHAARPAAARALSSLAPSLIGAAPDGALPVDWLQMLFLANDPELTLRKYGLFAAMPPDGAEAEGFVAVEDWANDGVPLATGVGRECLLDWYGLNRPGTGTWRIAGRPVRPETLGLPSFVAVPRDDRLVPPAQALALGAALPGATILQPAGAHVGMVVGPEAPERLWAPLAGWLATHLPGKLNAGTRPSLRTRRALG